MNDEEDKRQPPRLIPANLRFPLIASLVIGGLWLGVLILALCLPGNSDGDLKAEFGQLGDAFGMMNSLVGGFTIAFALYTISQQSKMIQLQEEQHQQERKDARNAVKAAKLEEVAMLLKDIDAQLAQLWIWCEELNGDILKFDHNRSYMHQLTVFGHVGLICSLHRFELPPVEDNIPTIVDTFYRSYEDFKEAFERGSLDDGFESRLRTAFEEWAKVYSTLQEWLFSEAESLFEQ